MPLYPIILRCPVNFLNDLNVSQLSSISSDIVKIIVILHHRESPTVKLEREGKIGLKDLLFSREAILLLCDCINIHQGEMCCLSSVSEIIRNAHSIVFQESNVLKKILNERSGALLENLDFIQS